MQDTIIQKYSARLAQATYDTIYLQIMLEEAQVQIKKLQKELEELKKDETEDNEELND